MLNSDELKDIILLKRIQNHNPTNDPYINIGQSITEKKCYDTDNIEISESEFIQSYLVPIEKKDEIYNKFLYGELPDGDPYFENNDHYITNEEFEEKGIMIERIVNFRHIPELELQYFEPTERLILYLNLHRIKDTWVLPYNQDEIIRKVGDKSGFDPHEKKLSIRKSELKDYLAARKCGLLLLRYSEVVCKSSYKLDFLPETYNNKETKYGHISFYNEIQTGTDEKFQYFTRLWDSFWIDPASTPRRRDYNLGGEFKGDIEFTFEDGEKGTFFDPIEEGLPKRKSEDRFFQIISLDQRVLNSILSKPKHEVRFNSLSNVDIIYPDSSILDGSINSEKQFQAFFGDIAKLDVDKQKHLAGYSEVKKAVPSLEYITVYIMGEFPPTWPFEETISKCLKGVNKPWHNKFGELLLLCPNSEEVSVIIRLGPLSNSLEELADVNQELRKILFPEGKIDNIKENIDFSSNFSNPDDYKNLKSLKYLKLLFEKNEIGLDKDSAQILLLIEGLRHAKSHPKDIPKILEKYNISSQNPLEIHYMILSKLCEFILNFKILTESQLDVKIVESDEEWKQLEFAKKYFEDPF